MNLRKDHCRNLPSRTTREHVSTLGGEGSYSSSSLFSGGNRLVSCISMLALERPSRAYKRTPACIAPRNLNERAFPRRPGNGVRAVGYVIFNMSKRLSATDISALASMKNVAKCDTWCELQNPVNHRVFERKLRPKPLGRGHACLGVTRRCPPNPLGSWAGRMMASRVLRHAVGIKNKSSATNATTIGGCQTSVAYRVRVSNEGSMNHVALIRRCFQRDPRSGGVTR